MSPNGAGFNWVWLGLLEDKTHVFQVFHGSAMFHKVALGSKVWTLTPLILVRIQVPQPNTLRFQRLGRVDVKPPHSAGFCARENRRPPGTRSFAGVWTRDLQPGISNFRFFRGRGRGDGVRERRRPVRQRLLEDGCASPEGGARAHRFSVDPCSYLGFDFRPRGSALPAPPSSAAGRPAILLG